MKYDLIVIGGGPAGYAAAMRALDFKKKILLIEKNKLGGAGVTNGALSSKTWWELSREASAFRKSLKRYNIEIPSISFKEIQGEQARATVRAPQVEPRKGPAVRCKGLAIGYGDRARTCGESSYQGKG